MSTASDLIALLVARGLTVATSESLTGGLLAARLTDVPGASAVVRGGLVVYASDVKVTVGGVPEALLHSYGPVSTEVAAALAASVRDTLGASYGLSVTGVAGPDPQPDQPDVPVGRVFVGIAGPGIAGPGGVAVVPLALVGDRAGVRAGAVDAALRALRDLIAPRTGA